MRHSYKKIRLWLFHKNSIHSHSTTNKMSSDITVKITYRFMVLRSKWHKRLKNHYLKPLQPYSLSRKKIIYSCREVTTKQFKQSLSRLTTGNLTFQRDNLSKTTISNKLAKLELLLWSQNEIKVLKDGKT